METNKIILSTYQLTYYLNRGNRKHTYLIIKDGQLLVRAPFSSSLDEIENILISKESWILDNLKASLDTPNKIPRYTSGEQFNIMGQPYRLTIQWCEQRHPQVIHEDGLLKILLPLKYKMQDTRSIIEKTIEAYLRYLANKEIPLRQIEISKLTGIYPEKLTIKKLTRSWGRCCSNGNISINYHLIKYPPKSIDYVILHELCHLKHMNHSKEFWNLVANYMPDHKKARDALK